MANPSRDYAKFLRKPNLNDMPPRTCACGRLLKAQQSKQDGICGICHALQNRYKKANKKRLEIRG